jgi:hypothetical protein
MMISRALALLCWLGESTRVLSRDLILTDDIDIWELSVSQACRLKTKNLSS